MSTKQIPKSGYDSGLQLLPHILPIVLRAIFRSISLVTLRCLMLLRCVPAPSYHPNALTCDFMTHMFIRKGILAAGEKVTCVVLEDMERGAIGQVQRIHLSYHLQTSKPPKTVVLKLIGTTMKDALVGSMVPLSENEYRAYTHKSFAPRLQGLQPIVYHIEMSSFGMGMIIMEDLSHLRHKKSREGGTLKEMEMLVTTCAKIHSRTLNRIEPRVRDEFQFHTYFLDHLTGINCRQALDGPWGPTLRQHTRLAATIEQFLDYDTSDKLFVKMRGFGFRPKNTSVDVKPFLALIHGDVRLDNCFFNDAENSVVMVDWQVIMPRAPMLDFGWLLLDCNNEVLGIATGTQLCNLGSDAVLSADGVDRCKSSINMLFATYLQVLSAELTQAGYDGERPTMAHCQEMLPWILYNNVFYIMVFIAQIFKGAPQSDAQNPVVQTFQTYADRLEWMLRVFVRDVDFLRHSE